ncbi:Hypothetical protein UVM_LOCUS134 [uncultured virus]|nr:Hypothetical protein UVM_LOCUS134 [uncultured virus]
MEEAGRTVILVGPTQNGKSALGNLLVGHAVFDVGTGLTSCTRLPSCVDMDWRGRKAGIRIVDTAGTGDTEQREAEKMLELYRLLVDMHDSERPLCCVLIVCKYPSVLNDEYRKNLAFYRDLFPWVSVVTAARSLSMLLFSADVSPERRPGVYGRASQR